MVSGVFPLQFNPSLNVILKPHIRGCEQGCVDSYIHCTVYPVCGAFATLDRVGHPEVPVRILGYAVPAAQAGGG